MAIKVAQVRGIRHQNDQVLDFPAKPLLYVDDKISLAASDVEDNSRSGRGGLGEAVFFSFRGLHEILKGAKTYLSFEDGSEDLSSEWRLNSRIISASLGRGRHIELERPVTIQLRHLEDPSTLKEPVCVFWDYEVHGWSDSGCRLVETNQTYSTCQCDHLTNFAVLMRPIQSGIGTHVRLDIVAYCVASGICLFVLVLFLKVS